MKPDNQPQNIYDDPQFFAGYSGLPRFQAAWGYAMEHGPFTEMLGDVSGLRVLDLGCGGGQLTYYLAEAGAAEVIGIDVSETMLDVARELRSHPCISYRRETLEGAAFPEGRFDRVVSSLALHYVEEYAALVRRIAGWLVPGGLLVFSTEHPIYTARATNEGWVRSPDGEPLGWAIDRYGEEGLREHEWFGAGVRRYHRTLATLLNGLIEAGFAIERVLESTPTDAWLQERPQDADERRRPMFLLLRARKDTGKFLNRAR